MYIFRASRAGAYRGPVGVVSLARRGPLLRACFLVCSPSQRGAIQRVLWANRHVPAVAFYCDGFIIGLRFEFLRFRAGGRNGRGSRTPMSILPGELTVMSGEVPKMLTLVWPAKPVVGLGKFVPVVLIFILSANCRTCDATRWLKALGEQKATDAGGARQFV